MGAAPATGTIISENMYTTVIDGEDYAIKPMNCPGGILVYQDARCAVLPRICPLRMGELGLVHRHELSGALHGLMRVRCFTQDDAHIFMTPEQIKDEINGVVQLMATQVYKTFRLATTISSCPRGRRTTWARDEDWEIATNGLRGALDELGVPYVINEGDGAFYGPKIDFHLEDCLGRTWQCGTIQLDLQLPERFEPGATSGADGERAPPDHDAPRGVRLHRALHRHPDRALCGRVPGCGSRPCRPSVLPISDRADEAAWLCASKLLQTRASALETGHCATRRSASRSARRRCKRSPICWCVGDKEAESGMVAVRSRKGTQEVMSTDALLAKMLEEIRTKAL